MCSLHSEESDFETDFKDSNVTRVADRMCQTRQKRTLVKHALPTIFPNLPKHLNKKKPEQRTTKTSVTERLQNEQNRIQESNNEFLASSNLSSFNEVLDKLKDEVLPHGAGVLQSSEENITLGSLVQDSEGKPFILYSMIICSDLTFSLFVGKSKISNSRVKHLEKSAHVQDACTIANILSFLKMVAEKQEYSADVVANLLTELEDQILLNDDEDTQKKMQFALEQLQLAQKSKKGRR